MADCDGDDDVDYLDQGNNNNKSHTTTVCDEDYDKDEPLEKKRTPPTIATHTHKPTRSASHLF